MSADNSDRTDLVADPSGRAGEVSAAPVVGIGASAGGLEAVSAFFSAMPADSGMCFLVVPHLDPERHSRFAELIAAKTAMAVAEATEGDRLAPDRVYVIPPDRTLTLEGNRMRVVEPAEPRGHRHPVDALFRSLAVEHGQRAVGIVLSGTGSNGTGGLREIQSHGGLSIAQAPETAGFDGMPRSAIDAGVVDRVLPPAEMVPVLLAYARHAYLGHGADGPAAESLAPDEGLLEAVLALLNVGTRHDFRGYRRPTLLRRLHRRMGLAHMDRLAQYLELLREQPGELETLAQDLLINVTGFFRDPKAWRTLEAEVIGPLVAARPREAPIRVWVPGCATGEEAYSVAMLLDEHRGNASTPAEIRVFASDVSEKPLARAREGLYAETLLEGIGPERRQRFFTAQDGGFRVRGSLRDTVVFARHDLLADPPFSRLDLICCRNVLIYLRSEAQKRLLAILYLALVRGGHLFLGSSEGLGARDELFETVSKSHRIFRRVGPPHHELVSFPGSRLAGAPATSAFTPGRSAWARVAGEALAARFGPASVLVDRRGRVLYFHGDTDRYLAQPAGEPTRDLVALARKGLGAPLRRILKRAAAEGEATVSARLWGRPDTKPLKITATPVDREGPAGLLLVSFEEQTAASDAAPAAPAESVDGEERGELDEELAAVREELRHTLQDAEASDEELKAANEELTSMNEELQSTNEELETSKEELQSLNEELRTVNAQLEHKVVELEEATADLSNLLASTDQSTLFLDRELRIRRFTSTATRLVEIIPTDLGRPLRQLATTPATEGLSADAERVLATLATCETEVFVGDRCYLRRVLPYRGRGDRIEGVVATFTDVTATKRSEQEAMAAREYAEAIVATVREPLVVLTGDLRVRSANSAFYDTFGVAPDAAVGRSVFELQGGRWDAPRLRELLAEVLPRERSVEGFELEIEAPGFLPCSVLLSAIRIESYELVLVALQDVTQRKHHEDALRQARDRAQEASGARERFLAALSHELRTPLTPALAIVSSLREDAAIGESARGALARVQRNLEHEARLIDDLLDFSRIESGRLDLRLREVDVAELVTRAAETLTPERLAAAGLTLTLALPDSPVTAWGDADRLVQVFHNLLGNAVKFTPDGGSIDVRVRRADDGSADVELTDSGVGIAPDHLPDVFARFGFTRASARDGQTGLGLGLSISRAIVQRHGGELKVASPGVGRGSTFTVRLPAVEAARDRPDPEWADVAAEGGPPPPGNGPSGDVEGPLPGRGAMRILLVEDHQDSREVFAELLEAMDHRVVTAGSVAAALSVAAGECGDGGAGIDLVICDIGLPDGSGLELMPELVARHGLPGIALTGYGMGSDVQASLEAGFSTHLTKPIDIGRLRQAIEALRGTS